MNRMLTLVLLTTMSCGALTAAPLAPTAAKPDFL